MSIDLYWLSVGTFQKSDEALALAAKDMLAPPSPLK